MLLNFFFYFDESSVLTLFMILGRRGGATSDGDYSHLLPMGSESEDDDFGDEKRTESDPEIKVKDAELGLINSKLKNGHGHGYNFRAPGKKTDPFCSPTRGAIMLALSLLFFFVGYMAGFFTPNSFKEKYLPKPTPPKIVKASRPWHVKLSDWGEFLFAI